MSNRRLRVLVIAYECSPARSHTPGSAWQILRRLAEWHELWVITEETQYRLEVEEYLAKDAALSKQIHFVFVPRKDLHRPGGVRPVLPIRQVLAYRGWHKRAYGVARRLHEQFGFDLVHLLRGDSFREPGYCWRLPIPFVWGPTGGRKGIPWRLMPVLGIRDVLLHGLRNLITAAQFYFSWRVRAAARKASCVIAQTAFTQQKFMEVHGIGAMLAHEQAADPSLAVKRSYDGKRPLSVGWVGRCIASKGLPILLRATSECSLHDRMFLHIVGEGPCRRKWEAQAARLGIANRCEWHGWLPQRETMDMMRRFDVLAFTSLLEATSTTVMEALSTGLPIICLKHCGFGDIVDGTCGIPIQVRGLRSVVGDFSAALASLLEKPDMVERLSQGACEKVRAYSWDQLATVIHQVYENAVLSNNPAPSQTSPE